MIYEILIIGLFLALLWVELVDISPGGIIVPGYLALYIYHPERIAVTLAVAIATAALYRFLSAHLILFGRRRFVLLLLLGALLAQSWLIFRPALASQSPELQLVGLIIPGIIASNIIRQKIIPTMSSCLAVTVATYALWQIVAAMIH